MPELTGKSRLFHYFYCSEIDTRCAVHAMNLFRPYKPLLGKDKFAPVTIKTK